jgi:hypothetical protein
MKRGALRENSKDIFSSLFNRKARYVMEDVATRKVPLHDVCVDVNRPLKDLSRSASLA